METSLDDERDVISRMNQKVQHATIRFMFFPSLTYNLILNKCGMRDWWSVIDETVILGALPIRWFVPSLLEEHKTIRRVLCLNEAQELKISYNETDWNNHSIDFLQLPTKDLFFSPTVSDIKKGVDFIMESRREGNRVYVHCKSGRVRSATIVAAYLIMAEQMTRDDAVEFLREKRPFVLFHQRQLDVLDEFQKMEGNGN
ncbi:hypothetical protein ACOME3_002070 [Neoechinorhynchus agilis]